MATTRWQSSGQAIRCDAYEIELVHACLALDKPLLGICRGHQILNVALGGTLHQDAYGTYTASDRRWTVLPRKIVHLVPDTLLADLTGPEPMTVNALHSQAVDRLGAGLRVAARDRGGMIQAIERVSDPFAIGVQWHPEHLFYARRQQALFRALVRAARAHADKRAQLAAVQADS